MVFRKKVLTENPVAASQDIHSPFSEPKAHSLPYTQKKVPGYAGHFLLGFDAVCNRGQIHISIELHVVKSQQYSSFFTVFKRTCYWTGSWGIRLPLTPSHTIPLRHVPLLSYLCQALLIPLSVSAEQNFVYQICLIVWIKMTSVLWVYFMYTEKRSQPISYQILHSLHMPVVLVVGKFTSRGWAFYDALAFLHYVAIDLNPGANRTIGIPPFVGPLGYVMQPSNRGQRILLQECPNSLRHYFLRTSLFSYVHLMHYLMLCHLHSLCTVRAEELLWKMFYKEGKQSRSQF